MGKNIKGRELGRGLSQRTDGRYEARAVINGVKIDLYGTSLMELKRAFEIEKSKALKLSGGIDKDMTLAAWYEEWFFRCKSPQLKNDITRNSYNRKAKNTLIKVLGDKRVTDITQMDIQMAVNKLSENYAKRTVQEALGVLRECMAVAAANRIIEANPVVCIKVKDANLMEERRVLSIQERRRFLEEAENNYYKEAFYILLLTGMRIGEFAGLQWEDVDFNKKCIHIRRSLHSGYVEGEKIEELGPPKTYNSYRDIPFFEETEQYFRDWKVKQDIYKKRLGARWRADPKFGNLVFTSSVGSPANRYVISHAIDQIVNSINMKEINKACMEGRSPVLFQNVYPHAFRHTFATACFEKSMDPVVVQAIMGHANYSTTISYTHVMEDKINDERIKIGAFLS